MKKLNYLLLSIIILFGLNLRSQGIEMVYNGNFETVINGPVTGQGQIEKADGWNNISHCYPIPTGNGPIGSPDLLSRFSTNSFYGVPYNGFVSPSLEDFVVGNNNYAHISRSISGVYYNPFTEVMEGELTGYLQAGCYDFSALAADSKIPYKNLANNRFNVYLTDGTCPTKLLIHTSTAVNLQTWMLKTGTFTITPAQSGLYNRIRIEMVPVEYPEQPWANNNFQDILLDQISIIYHPIVLSLTGNTTFCEGDPLTFNGSITSGAGTANGQFWEIAESDANGNISPGAYVWNSWFAGAPSGSFTFPTLPLVCGKYYSVKLATNNACTPWSETSMVIRINCNPDVTLPNETILCSNDNFPITINAAIGKKYTYSWTYNGTPISGTSLIGTFNGGVANVNVVGTYCVTVTSNLTGCSTTACTEVKYDPRMQCTAEFVANTNCNGSSPYFDVTATFPLLCEGMSYYWEVCEIEAGTGNLINCSTNPQAWWTGGTTLNFPGYTFVQGHSYQIVRGIWSVPDNCVPWQAYVATPVTCNAGGKNAVYSSVLDKSIKKPTTGSLKNVEFSIYPNPTTGDFTANLEIFTAGDLLQVLDYSGKVVLEKNITANNIDLNIADMANGLYFVKVISANGISVEKLIKN